MSSQPVVVAVAITGSVPRKKDNPAVPVTVAEQIESTQQAYQAGATLAHIHVPQSVTCREMPRWVTGVSEGVSSRFCS